MILDTLFKDANEVISWTWRRVSHDIVYRKDDQRGKIDFLDFRERIFKEDLAFFKGVFDSYVNNPKGYLNVNVRYRVKQDYRWVNIIGSAVESDDTGEVLVMRGILLDVDEVRHIQTESNLSYEMFSRFMDENPGIAYIVDQEGRYVYGNKSWANQFSEPLTELLGKSNFDLFRLEQAIQFSDENKQAIASDESVETTYCIKGELGENLWYTTLKFKIIDSHGNIFVAGYTLDITSQKRQEVNMSETSELMRLYLDNISDVILVIDIDGNIMDCNPAAIKELGYSRQMLMKSNISDISEGFNPEKFAELWRSYNYQESIVSKRDLLHRTGRKTAFEIKGSKISTSVGDRIIAVCRNLNPMLENEAKIEMLAYYDHLTQLPNRVNFNRYLESLIQKVDSPFSMMFLDLDNFKFINDVYGHDFGDEVLIKVAERIKRVNGIDGFAARLSGDEFIVIIESTSDEIIEKSSMDILTAITEPMMINGIHMDVTCSIGTVNFPTHGMTSKELLRNADIAMYKAKEIGKNQIVAFEHEMLIKIQHKSIVANAIIEGLKNREFRLMYQPIFDKDEKTVKGFEALMRWKSRTLGDVSPTEFIAIAEETGTIVELGKWLMREVFKQSAKWEEYSNARRIFITMNISAVQIMQEDFLDTVRNLLSETGANPRNIVIEVTENVLLESTDYHINKLNMLKTLGFQIAMDDYGTGYTSMNYIRVFPIGIIKIDRSYIANIGEDYTNEILIDSFVYFAHRLKMKIVAEGIETEEQLEYLRKSNIDCYQGYYFSKPIDAESAQKYIEL